MYRRLFAIAAMVLLVGASPAAAVNSAQPGIVSNVPAEATPAVLDGVVNAVAQAGGKVIVGLVDRLTERLDQRGDDVGVIVEKLRGRDEVGGHELSVGPQLGFVEEHVAAALEHQSGRPWFGHPRAVEIARLQGGQGVGVVLRPDRDVAAAGGVGLVSLLGQPRPQRDVLCVAERRRCDRGSLKCPGIRGGSNS